MGYRGMGPMGNGALGVWGTRGMSHMGNGVLGVWGIWAMSPTRGMGYRGMGHMGNRDTGGMGYKGYGPRRQWDTWAMGYRGMDHIGNGAYGQFCSQNIKKMSSCQKDVKLSKRCQMSKNETPRLWRRFTKKLN